MMSDPYLHAVQGMSADERFALDKFMFNRKLLSLGKYYLYNEAGQPLFYIDRPLLKMKSEFSIYLDDTKSQKVLSLTQDSAMTVINFTFTLRDQYGQPLAYFKRQGWMSMLRRTWDVYDAQNQHLAIAQEDSWAKAIIRRVAHDSLIGLIFLTNFIINRPDGTKIGDYIRKSTFRDNHLMDMSGDPMRTLDRRIVVALAILLDNMEHR
jgi:uncharacterized protein YxjI